MPIIKSAKKRLRADDRKKRVNLRTKRKIRIALKKYLEQPSKKSLSEAYSALDVAAKKHVIPKGRANRKKSRLTAASVKNSNAKKTPQKSSVKKPRLTTSQK